jgi:hypothetical protein
LGDDDFGWQEWIPEPGDYDFDLLPWINGGKLLWIAPDDDSLAIKSDPACPYLNLSGNRFCQVVSEGQVWEDHLFEASLEAEIYEAEDSEEPAEPVMEPEKPEELAKEPPSEAPPKPKFCRQCGAQLKPTARFCSKCGTPVAK